MRCYARKISSKSSLFKISSESINLISSDVLKSEFRTMNQELSFWECENYNNSNCVQDTMLAMFLADQKVDDIYMIFFSEEDIRKLGISLVQCDSNTGLVNAESKHYNLVNLNIDNILKVIELYKSYLDKKNIKYHKEIKKKELPDLVKNVVEEKRFNHEKVTDQLATSFMGRKEFSKIFTENGYDFILSTEDKKFKLMKKLM